MELDFIIDKLTESIENTATGESLKTFVVPVLSVGDLKDVTKKNGWNFDWKKELRLPERKIYKLVTEKEPNVIQGLICLEKRERDKSVYMPLVESAPFNIGNKKSYYGVCGNLTAYACKLSKEYGFDGVVYFDAKTALVEHYEKTLGAIRIGGQRMVIFEEDAQILIDKYFS